MARRPRVSWRADEDDAIRRAVATFGRQWCTIAIMLPSRSADAVRNRYDRLCASGQKHEQGSAAGTEPTHAAGTEPITATCIESSRRPWTDEEDARVLEHVREHGRDWRGLSAQLPMRTAKAIRNRYNRLVEVERGALSWLA